MYQIVIMWRITPALLLLCILVSCKSENTSSHAIIDENIESDTWHSSTIKADSTYQASGQTTFKYSDTLKEPVFDTLRGVDRFIGLWSKDSDSYPCDYIDINEDTSIFGVSCNQLGVECKNKFHGDTLYLYVISTDQGRGFMGPRYYPPRSNSLFAKCYVIRKMLKIIYTQSMYSKNIEDLELNTVLYKWY